MQNFRVSTIESDRVVSSGSNWQHDYYTTREEAETAAREKSRRGCFAVVARMDETGNATYLCEYAAREGGAA